LSIELTDITLPSTPDIYPYLMLFFDSTGTTTA